MTKHWRQVITLLVFGVLAGCAQMSVGPQRFVIEPVDDPTHVLTATGYATISSQPHPNPAQQRLMAIRASKLDAYRSLAEQVYGQYVDASTSIGDLVMQNDQFQAQVRGVIYGAKLERINPVGSDTYEVTLSLPAALVQDLRDLYLRELAIARR